MGQIRIPNLAAVQPQIGFTDQAFYVAIDFGGSVSDVELANSVSLFIANIACLKDHLKAWCKMHDVPFNGDKLIDSNRDVGLIHDLWNRDKHFDLDRSRTGLFPELRNIARMARLSTKADAGSWIAISLDPRTGQLRRHGDGTAEVVIDADVVDSKGIRLGGLIDISERAIAEWEAALTVAGVGRLSSPINVVCARSRGSVFSDPPFTPPPRTPARGRGRPRCRGRGRGTAPRSPTPSP